MSCIVRGVLFVVIGLPNERSRALAADEPSLAFAVACAVCDGEAGAVEPFVVGFGGVVPDGWGAEGKRRGALAGVVPLALHFASDLVCKADAGMQNTCALCLGDVANLSYWCIGIDKVALVGICLLRSMSRVAAALA